MAVILLLITLLGCAFYFFHYERNGIRESFLLSYLLNLFLILIGTEILSLVDRLSYSGIISYWGIVLLSLLAGIIFNQNGRNQMIRLKNRIKKMVDEATKLDMFLVFILIFILSITFLTALLSPPNNFDSMTYHLARVAQWIQHQDVKFYPTSIPRQNYSMPLAEYAILHIQVLSRSDMYANLVQWVSFCLSIIGVSLVVNELQGSRFAQLFSGLLAGTVPMAILQSSSTQNDLVVSALCISFAYYLIRLTKSLAWKDATFSSLSMGLALLTKGTAYLFCAGVGLGIGWWALISRKGTKRRKMLILLVLIIIGALSLNVGFFIRNLNLYGLPLSPENKRITVDSFSLVSIYTNSIRNFAIHLATPIAQINGVVSKVVHVLLGDNLNYAPSTFENSIFKIQYLINEDFAGNLFHAFLLPIGLIYFVIRNKDVESISLHYLIGLSLSMFFYIALIKWQPWASRLHTPLFLLAIPLLGLSIGKISVKKFVPNFVAVILFLYSLPFLFLNSTRPWIPFFKDGSLFHTNVVKSFFSNRPKLYNQFSSVLSPFYQGRSILHTDRQKLYFMSQFDYYWDYVGAMRKVNESVPDEIGLCMESNDWEYPFWVLAGQHAQNGDLHFIHIDVNNRSQSLRKDEKPIPEYVLATREDCPTLAKASFEEIYNSDYVDLFKKIDTGGE